MSAWARSFVSLRRLDGKPSATYKAKIVHQGDPVILIEAFHQPRDPPPVRWSRAWPADPPAKLM